MQRKNLILFILAYPLAVLLPIIMDRSASAVFGYGFVPAERVFECFGLCTTLLILLIAYREWKGPADTAAGSRYPLAVILFFAFGLLAIISQSNGLSVDYRCFENAAKALGAGTSLYDNTNYEYPPLLAQIMALGAQLISALDAKSRENPDEAWRLIHYLYQTVQYLLGLVVFFQLTTLAKRLGLAKPASVVAAALLLFLSVPFRQTLAFAQTNLAILAVVLFVLMYSNTRGRLAGLLLAAGALLNLYPLILLFPIFLCGRSRAFLFAVISGLGILLLQTRGFTDTGLFQQFIHFFSHDYPAHTHFRNNCVYSFVANSVTLFHFHAVPLSLETRVVVSKVVTALVQTVILFWFGARIIGRERIYRIAGLGLPAISREPLVEQRFLLHGMDMLPLMLLIAPTMWEHHLVLITPFALYAALRGFPSRPLFAGLALALVFLVPVFNVYPLSYHRVAGLLMLVWLVPLRGETAFLRAIPQSRGLS